MNDELIEERFYVAQRDILMAHKNKEPYEHYAHIQAQIVKSKLISFTKFLCFLRRVKIIY